MTRAILLCALLLAAAAPAEGQRVWNGGFAGAGVAEGDGRYLEPSYTFVFGWDTRWNVGTGLLAGLRGAAEWSRLEPDEEAYLDSLGVAAGDVEGGVTTVVGTGFDLLGGYQAGSFGGHAWVGVRYVRDHRNELTVRADGGDLRVRGESRADLGGIWGAGVSWRFAHAGLFAEWFQTGGFDDEMVAVQGVRAGLFWSW